MRRILLTLIGIGCGCLIGCGTFSDAVGGPANDHVYYRGVRFDLEAMKEGGPNVLLAADVPFSAVADTLLIPYYARIHREREENSPENDPRKVDKDAAPERIKPKTRSGINLNEE